jgi:hypothetical protein
MILRVEVQRQGGPSSIPPMIVTMAVSIGPDVDNNYLYIIELEVIAIAKIVISPIISDITTVFPWIFH